MKQKISFLLALVMLFGLFAGCTQHDGESQPGTEPRVPHATTQAPTQAPTEPVAKEPPRTAEDFIDQLSDAMQARNIPAELVLEWDEDYSEDSKFAGYMVNLTNGKGNYGALRIVLYYLKAEPGTLSEIQIILYDSATEQEREVYPVLSGMASVLCDRQMTEEKAAELFAVEPSDTRYVIYTGDIGSFTKTEVNYVPVSDDPNEENFYLDDSCYSAVFCQPYDLVHNVIYYHDETPDCYRIVFGKAGEKPYPERHFSAPSVEELERRINDVLAARGIPIACTIVPYETYGRWNGIFRYTTLEDPDFAYPEFPYEEYLELGYLPEQLTDEKVMSYIFDQLSWVKFTVSATEPVRKDALIKSIDCYEYECEALPELLELLFIACDLENGAADLSALQNIEAAESVYEGLVERVLQKDGYSITEYVDKETGWINNYRIEYDKDVLWHVSEPTGEELLDPALLEYDFWMSEPMVVDGWFNFEQVYQSYFHGSIEYFYLGDLLNDYLQFTRSNLCVDPYWDHNGEHYNIKELEQWNVLDSSVYRIDNYDVAVDVKYNVNIQDYVEYGSLEREHVLRIPIGISLLLDEAMTVEEAIKLHTHAMAYDFIATEEDMMIAPNGYQVTVYGTGDVVHILAEDPKTGANTYTAILRTYASIDPDYSRVLQYLDG